MKKTLVALAVLASAGSAFADSNISLTGDFGAGVQRNLALGGLYGRTGIAVTDGSLTFAGTEDLGSGLAAGFSLTADFFRPNYIGASGLNIGGVGSNVAVGPLTGEYGGTSTDDAFLTLGGGFGTVKAGLWESRSWAWDYGNVAPISLPTDPYDSTWTGVAGVIVQSAARDGKVQYTTPAVLGGLKLALQVSERDYGVIDNRLLYAGTAATKAGPEEGVSALATYAAGGLSVGLAAKNVNVKDKNSYQLGGNYDLGVVKVGLGVDYQQKLSFAGKKDDRTGYLVSAAAPIGPITLGATYMQSDAKYDPAFAALAAEYAISKRTSINASAGKYLGDSEFKDLVQGEFRVKLHHSF